VSYELDDIDRALLAKLRDIQSEIEDRDPPLKDFLDEDDIYEALDLLLAVTA
jgi:hypothetical protein